MMETVFRNADEIDDFVCNFRSEAALGKVHLGFHEWMRQLEWVCEHDGEYVPE
jgi:hypothetical protein